MQIKNSHGLVFDFLDNGGIRSIEADSVRINLKKETLFAAGVTNFYLRKRTKPYEFKPLLGPRSNSRFGFGENAFISKGSFDGLDYECALMLSPTSMSWQWVIDITNNTEHAVDLDLFCVQDIGLKQKTDGLMNGYYVSQYLERRILSDAVFGKVICCRQNMKEPAGYPWLMMACLNGASSASVDGMSFYGRSYRETGIPEGLLAENLEGEYAGESSVVALQERPFGLTAGGDHHRSLFVARYMPDHPEATSEKDLEKLSSLRFEFDDAWADLRKTVLHNPVLNMFNTAGFLPVMDLGGEEISRFFEGPHRHHEFVNGALLSFFYKENCHVMLRRKELLADRPHAHIMQARSGVAPDENIMSTTAFAFGIFNSHISQGNTNFNVLLSICNSQFNLEPETGQRIIVELDGKPFLLGVPSAFEMGLNHCRWIYKTEDHLFEVRTWTSGAVPQINLDFRVLTGGAAKLWVTHDFDPLNGWSVIKGNVRGEFIAKPRPGSMITGIFPKAQFRISGQGIESGCTVSSAGALFTDCEDHGTTLFVLDFEPTLRFAMSFTGEVSETCEPVMFTDSDQQWLLDQKDALESWRNLSLDLRLKSEHPDIRAIREILPWFGMNALTHYLTPYGLEQFSGAAWGTRDVSQGPFDLLLSMERYDEARRILLTIFSNQNPDGGWPQWWMFDSYRDIRSDEAHGDIIYWTIIALTNYITTTGDLNILGEVLPYYAKESAAAAEATPLAEHVDRLISMITGSFIHGTSLVPFGGGDWNDSLQPVNKDLAQRMISSWTVEMNYQAFSQYRTIYERAGKHEKARELGGICEKIKADFNRYLVRDEIVAGYGLVDEEGNIGVLLHPSDTMTGIHYSILPMERGILSGMFTREQALLHQDLIEYHLKGPDGARLMDRPLKYKGGIQTIFQRAESSTFFGREIGLMYIHEHIRYAESLACTGKAGAFVRALRQANPVGYHEIVPCGDVRQSNCYYSSSDVIFGNRYEADERYDEIRTGRITLRGGWRIYSSGPGIYIGLVVNRLLGLRTQSLNFIIDPVMPHTFDGLEASIMLSGRQVTFIYRVEADTFGPKSVIINGKPVVFTIEDNRYRRGGAVISKDDFLKLLDQKENQVVVLL